MEGRGRLLIFLVLPGLALAAAYAFGPPRLGGLGGQSTPAPQATQAKPRPRDTAPAAPAAPVLSAAQSAARKQARAVERIETDHFVAEVVNLNGGLQSFRLKEDRYQDGDRPIDIVTTDKERFLPLAIAVEGLPADAVFKLERLSDDELRLSYRDTRMQVVRRITASHENPYQLWLTTRIENTGSQPLKTRLQIATYRYIERAATKGKIPLLPVRSPELSHSLCRVGDELSRETHEALYDADNPVFGDNFRGLDLRGPVAFAAVESTYFVSAIAPSGDQAAGCRVLCSPRDGRDPLGKDATGDLFAADLRYPELELAPGKSHTYRTLAYLGPKTPRELAKAGHNLKDAIETGFFTGLAEGLTWLLRQIHDLVGNWGLAIIMLTFVVKLTLFPLTAKQMQSMARMKELKPEIDAINERFADDREAKGAAMMDLYKRRKVNPAAGCVPVLLQLPIWFSLYSSLATNVELFHADFAFWWTDLSKPDPYFSLPLALGALMFVQQKMSPNSGMDPLQQKMMLYMMPTMITSFMLFLPVGLCLYMFTNSALSIIQQRVIEARLAAATAAGAARHEADKTSPSPEATQNTDISPPESGAADKARPKSSRPSKAERRSRRGK